MATINLGKVITDQQKAVLDKQSYDSVNSKLVITGDENVDGNFTADSIIENMSSSYRFSPFSTAVSEGFEITYAGIVKNGNKLTMCVAGTFTPNENTIENPTLGYFYYPTAIDSKLYNNALGYLANFKTNFYSSAIASSQLDTRVYKGGGNDAIGIQFFLATSNLTQGTQYAFRVEITFLLSDNLVQ